MQFLKKFISIFILVNFFFAPIISQATTTSEKEISEPEYPVIFVHGLAGSDLTFEDSLYYFSKKLNWGPVYAFDIVLNADNNNGTSNIADDVRYMDWNYQDREINVGRRNFALDIDDFRDGWQDKSTKLFALNFAEERIRGAAGTLNDFFDNSNQAAAYKQGYAIKIMIKEVLSFTGADKVILVGHSMGGIAIREYLQRRENGKQRWWLDPEQQDGHHVAKVITIGTPHLGSNSGPDTTGYKQSRKRTTTPRPNREAIRDVKYSFSTYPNCPDSGDTRGIYLFGGNEKCIAGTAFNYTFGNVDINCNGSEDDEIIGISKGTSYNPELPLPMDIHYIYIISDSQMGECNTCLVSETTNGIPGDGAVLLDRQWLYSGEEKQSVPVGTSNVISTNFIHNEEGEDYHSILSALQMGLGDDDDVTDVPYSHDKKILERVMDIISKVLILFKDFVILVADQIKKTLE